MVYPEDFDDIILFDLSEFEKLPRRTQVACCIHALEAEVNNGGLEQFFTNSSGRFVLQTMEALTAIGAATTRSILEKAIDTAYPEGYPSDPLDHEEISNSDDDLDRLGKLDDQFYAYKDSITDLVNRYLSGDA